MTGRLVLTLCGICLFSACGDDDGGNQNQNNQNQNSSATCGNSLQEAGEQCDDGPANSDSTPDACRTDCRIAYCGDGTVDTAEACDDGPANSDEVPDACREDCTSPRCGDGVVDVGQDEECDDGSTIPGDRCDAECRVEYCGNGRVDPGEQCDGESDCGPTCLVFACGNGVKDPEEECDDGGNDAGDTCGPTCLVERCGNGYVDPGEVCDDGNNVSGDDCSADCLSLELCGNSYLDLAPGEECDDGGTIAGDGCGPTCLVERCGNGYPDPGEECDDGGREPGDTCGPTCLWEECGNLVIDPGEECDDGNLRSLDGCSSGCTVEFMTWLPVGTSFRGRTLHSMGYDAARDRVVLFGGTLDNGTPNRDTWEYEGINWRRAHPLAEPPKQGSMTFHGTRQRLVMAVGSLEGATTYVDLWEYDGTTWVPLPATNRPTATTSKGTYLTYDGARDRLLLLTNAGTSAFTGGAWVQLVAAASSPPDRSDSRMVYDSVRDRAVLIGGMNTSTSYRNDVWEFNGTSWQERTGTGMVLLGTHSAVYHAGIQRVLVYGGLQQPGNVYNDRVYSYDGTSFVTYQPAVRPAGRRMHDAGYDSHRQVMVIFGGSDNTAARADTWELSFPGGLATWTETTPMQAPEPRAYSSMAYAPDQEVLYLFGGRSVSTTLGDTWIFDGQAWLRQLPASSPPARYQATMAYDPARGRLVLFGGLSSSLLNDTWEHDGTTWSEITTANRPSARESATLSYHEPTGQMVLFGGSGVSGGVGDTWLYDGVDWTRIYPSPSPEARAGAVMWHDPSLGTLRLFGGWFAPGYSWEGNLWEFDGSGWTEVSTYSSIPGGSSGVAYDLNLEFPLLFGGHYGNLWLSDLTYEVTDSGLSRIYTAFLPEARMELAMAHHGGLPGTLIFGGLDAESAPLGDTWVFGYVSQVPAERCYGGQDEDGDMLVDCLDPDCERKICPDGRCVSGQCRPYEERCGDGQDEDGDGLVDCQDPDCNGRPCRTGLCANQACQ